MFDYQKDYTQKAFKREAKLRKKLLTQYHQLLSAADEGVFEVTVRSQSGAITVPVDLAQGSQLTVDLVDFFTQRLQRLENNINNSQVELGVEVKTKRKQREAQVEQDLAGQLAGGGQVAA